MKVHVACSILKKNPNIYPVNVDSNDDMTTLKFSADRPRLPVDKKILDRSS